ncbi:50S ribosomal protein L25 [Clostridium tagluense]|uniref:50S ribosomal protein L25 n=1 Tax=Clostridium tagluense TaxID=360422 RepID=A0A401UJZ6_9CLOT|nr:50S ribosomal protein L25 [Clostridium tagluense]MCB2310693.1 50S ribosomal protein L25 [Clostridium tagluense]MCB2315577.1 50S ribosomal protein L25 [Clostridium tagluense]MCB2320431.1 50S ribosomal protein L25 [Clostridium tagluense]MCB2325286.1 50S ribosomal protein L25 [Clostridium tagluense]MCB2330138.1 50S ribosomal protein L25 [Clostridium tagluense]
MEKVILDAFERIPGNKKFKEDGFIAGVIYGDNIEEAISVKIELMPLKKILGKHGSNAKVWVKYGEDKKFGFIKEIQRHPVTAIINHVDIQVVSLDHEIKLQLPLSFKGEANLIDNLLELNIHKSEIDVFGNMALMPDGVSVDVSGKKLGDTITIKDFDLDAKIKVTDEEDQIYAAIVARKEQVEEETTDEPVVAAEPVVEA